MITIVKPDQSYSRQNLTVQCSCGRALRAKIESAGSEIQCWECHRKVPVPLPRSVAESYRALREGWYDVCERGLVPILVGAAVALTCILAVPRAGVTLATGALVAVGLGYGMLLRRSDDTSRAPERNGQTDGACPEAGRPVDWARRGAAALVFALGLSAPFLLARGGLGGPAQFAGMVVPALTGLVFALMPLAMLAAFSPAGPRVVPALLRWRPGSMLFTLAALPLLLALVEFVVVLVTFWLGIFGGLMIDLVPTPTGLRERMGCPPDWLFKFGIPADIHFLGVYFNRLGHGYTLVGAILPSLMMPSQVDIEFWASIIDAPTYYCWRLAVMLLSLTCILHALALQSCWLGRLSRLEGRLLTKRAPAAEVSP